MRSRTKFSAQLGWSCLVGIGLLAISCDVADRASESQQPQRPVPMSWLFEPSEHERVTIQDAISGLFATTGVDPSQADIEVRRFGAGRFLLLSAESSQASGSARRVVLRLVGADGSLSSAFDTHVFDHPGRFQPVDVSDLDGDGLEDFVFCGWTADSHRSSFILGVGYRSSGWYLIDDTRATFPKCPVRNVP